MTASLVDARPEWTCGAGASTGVQVGRICPVAAKSAGRSGSMIPQSPAAAWTLAVVITVIVNGRRPGFGTVRSAKRCAAISSGRATLGMRKINPAPWR